MFAGSVTSSTSTPALPILSRVLASRCSYSSSGNAAIRYLLGRLPAEQQMLEHELGGVEVIEVDPLVGAMRGLLDVARSEQNAWYPGAVDEEAGVARGSPRRDPAGNARLGHRRGHRPHQLVILRDLECHVVRAGQDIGLEPRQSPPCAGDGSFELTHHLLLSLARVETAVHLDDAAVRHHVWARAAVDRAYGQARRSGPRMGAARPL